MSKILEALTNGLNRYRTYLARARARRELLARSDRFLADVGISRERLEEGVRAWPWRDDRIGGNLEPATAGRVASARDFFSQSEFTAMGLASKGNGGHFGHSSYVA